MKLGVGFKAEGRVSAYFTKLGWRCGCIFVGLVCVRGWVYMFIWLGCVRRVGMYWEGGRRETTPLYHICYIKFISSWKKILSDPINLKRWLKLKTKIASVQNKKKSFIYNKDIILPNLTLISKLGWLKKSARRALVILC